MNLSGFRNKPWSMKGRILVHHMVTLGLVLFAFSLALYVLAGKYLDRQVDDGLEAAAIMLEAAMEPTPDGLEWEPNQLPILIREAPLSGRVLWLVRDPQGNMVGNSGPEAVQIFHDPIPIGWDGTGKGPRSLDLEGGRWRIISKEVHFDPNPFFHIPQTVPKPPNRYSTLHLCAAFHLKPVQETLGLMAWVLFLLSLVVWFVAFGVGLWICRATLAPLIDASAAAEAIQLPGFHERIQSPGTGDELDRLIQSFNGLLQRLEQSHEKQRRFTGDASHQLRTPLAGIMGQIEVALRRDRSPEEYVRVLGGLGRQAKQMHQMVESLLFLARSRGEDDGRKQNLELYSWVQKQRESWDAHPRFSDIEIIQENNGPFLISVNSDHLANLLMILLDNSLKYSEAGTPVEIGIQTKNAAGGKVMSLTVRDYGMGFEEEDLERIFEPFYRAPESRRLGISGLGLGLALAMRLAEEIGATLHAARPAGGGAMVEIRMSMVSE